MDYKDFIMILSSYKCNKNCPYCIAKIERLPEIKEDLIQFKNQIDKLIQDKARFKYFVLSGNGEPSYYTYEFLEQIVSIVTNSGIFEDYRIQIFQSLLQLIQFLLGIHMYNKMVHHFHLIQSI